MLISASRRTDIPAFYAAWFMNRLREGYCLVPNPFNAGQVQHISLLPKDVEAIVFWTRHARPLYPYLEELDERGYRYYFQYTLLDYPAAIDLNNPAYQVKTNAFRELAQRIGPERVIWRYDPIIFSTATPEDFHLEAFSRLAATLEGHARRAVISLLSPYTKIKKRMQALEKLGVTRFPPDSLAEPWLGDFMRSLSEIAASHGMQIGSCASELDFSPFGIPPGKCIDDQLLKELFDLDASHIKDSGQRKACGCVISKDIGMYDSCIFGCQYCYATTSFSRARHNHARHDPQSPSLIG